MGSFSMKKVILTGAAAAAALLTGPAMAADLAPVYKAPPPPVAYYDWTGVYIGGNVGYGWGRTEIEDPSFFGTNVFFIPTERFNTSGVVGGGQIGWNYQFQRFVFGTEVTFNWSDVKQNNDNVPLLFGAANIQRSSQANWYGTATTRWGVTWWDHVLFYSKIGVAWGHFNYNDSLNITGIGNVYNSGASETRTGWTVGTGIEWAFAGAWSAKIEYNYLDFGTKSIDFLPVAGIIPVNLNINQNISTITVGLNYRFNWVGPVVARY
jgi:outer membrane immunogenic protein